MLEMRYRGQGHQLSIAYDGDLATALDLFHQAHKRVFGYDRRDQSVEVMLVRLSGSAPAATDQLPLPVIEAHDEPVIASSPLWIGDQWVEVPVYDRARLAPGTELTGPLIIEQQDTTLVVGTQTLTVDRFGGISIGMKP